MNRLRRLAVVTRPSRFVVLAALSAATSVVLAASMPASLKWVAAIPGAPVVFVLPGWFMLGRLGATKVRLVPLLYSVAFSVLNLIGVGMAANYLPRIWGVGAPLHTPAVSVMFGIEMVAILGATTFGRKGPAFEFPRLSKEDWTLIFMGFAACAASVVGAVRLNNGASGAVSTAALGLVLVSVTYALVRNKRLTGASLAVAIACNTVAVLFMTSLRGWLIVGHDIRLEYEVFNLTARNGFWNPGSLRTDYNACLSLTIFPLVVSQLLHVSGEVVFKVIDQVLFALCPLGLFALLRKYTSQFMAFVGAILFIGLPTVSIDLAMLTRQEMAYEFLSLALLAWFTQGADWLKRHARLIFLAMSAGVILAHYSTAYLYVVALVLAAMLTRVLARTARVESQVRRVSGTLTAVIALATVLWYVQMTNVARELASVLVGSWHHMADLTSGSTRSVAVGHVIPGFTSTLHNDLVTYIMQTAASPVTNLGAILSILHPLTPDMAGTKLALAIGSLTGLDVPQLMYAAYYQIGTSILEALILFGVGLAAWQFLRRRPGALPVEALSLSIVMVFMMAMLAVAPGLSVEYGVTRFFEQAYLVLALPMMLGLAAIANRLWARCGYVIVGIVTIGVIAVYTNFIPQLVGGLPPALALNNSGPYYGLYYAQPSDMVAADRMARDLPSDASVSTNNFVVIQAYEPNYRLHLNDAGVLPFQLPSGSYVLLTADQVERHELYIDQDVNPAGVELPASDYATANLVYTSGSDDIYSR